MCRIVRYDAFTLLEMLVALMLSVLLMLMVSTLFTTLLLQYERQQSLNATQAHARVAVHWISKLIHSAGNCGCQSAFQREGIDNHVLGYNDFFSREEVLQIENNAVLEVHRVASDMAKLLSVDRKKETLTVSNVVLFDEGDVLLVSDCAHAEIVRVNFALSTAGAQQLTLSSPLLYDYDASATVASLEKVRLWVSDTGRVSALGKQVYGLYIKINDGRNAEIESGINVLALQSYEENCLIKVTFSLPLFSKEMTWVRYVEVSNAAVLSSSPAQAGDPYKKNNK